MKTFVLALLLTYQPPAVELARVEAAEHLTDCLQRDETAQWRIIAAAATMDCSVMIVHVMSMDLNDADFALLHYGRTGFLGVTDMIDWRLFRGVAYVDASNEWWFPPDSTVTRDELRKTRGCH